MMKMNLEELLRKYLFRAVMIKLITSENFVFRGYIVGLKLPVNDMLMLYYVKEQHIEKYIKHQNSRWIEMLPFEMVDQIEVISPANEHIEDLLHIMMKKKDITYREED